MSDFFSALGKMAAFFCTNAVCDWCPDCYWNHRITRWDKLIVSLYKSHVYNGL